MRPTEVLRHEHDLIFVMLMVVDSVCLRIESGRQVESGHLRDMIDFMRNFIDRSHHVREEEIFFPALEAAGLPREAVPIVSMVNEHEICRALLGSMEDAFGRMERGHEAAGQFRDAARHYLELLVGHIARENNVLFPLAEKKLSDARQDAIMEGFDRLGNGEAPDGILNGHRLRLHNLRMAYLM